MNRFSRVFLLFFILAMLISTIGCKETFYSEWKDDDIVVDGFNKDWNNHGKMFLEDVGMSFGMTNDADSLYLLMQFRDVKTHKMFARSGATIWFCKDGKKDKKLGYKYYGKELIEFKDQQQMKPPQGMDQNANMPQNFGGRPGGKEMMGGGGMPDNAEHYNKVLVVDSEEEIFESLSENGPIGPHAGCGYSEGVFVYEFVFPLKQEYSYSLDIDPGQEVLVCIDFPPAMPSTSSNRSGGPGGGGPGGGGGMGGPPGGGGGGGGAPSGGMGGGPGGGGPGGGKPGGGGPGEMNLKPRTMWFSLQLAPEAE